jgi:hypothetical protein
MSPPSLQQHVESRRPNQPCTIASDGSQQWFANSEIAVLANFVFASKAAAFSSLVATTTSNFRASFSNMRSGFAAEYR